MSTGAETADEGEIRDLIETWATAVRNKDLEGIVARHSPEILMFDLPPPLQSVGIQAYKKTWDLFFAWAVDPTVFDIAEMKIVASTDVAFATALMRCSGTEKSGEKIALDFRLTVGLQRIDGCWTVVHEHHSIPAS